HKAKWLKTIINNAIIKTTTAEGFRSTDLVVADEKFGQQRNRNMANKEASAFVTERHVQLWTSTAFRTFLSLVGDRGRHNDIICVPQLLAVIALLSEVADHRARVALNEYLQPNAKAALPQQISPISEYLRSWEEFAETAAKPGSFNSNRRLLIHPMYTKSYGFETFMALKYLGIEMKIFEPQSGISELIAWIRRSCRTEEGALKIPYELWKNPESKSADLQMTNNQKCPILLLASHFYIPMSTNILDVNHVYLMNFKDREECEVVACRYWCRDMPPFRCISLPSGFMITLPTFCDDIAAYCVSNVDESSFKDAKELTDLVAAIRATDEQNCSFTPLTELYMPLFCGLPTKATNIADILAKSIPRIDKLFQPDGFGDLGIPGHEASHAVSTRLTTSIQCIDRIEIMHTPNPVDITLVKRIPRETEQHALLDRPFLLIVWDNIRNAPLYLARIANPVKKTEKMKVDGMDPTKEISIEARKMCSSIRKIGGWLHSTFRKGIGDTSVKTS
uniref:Serpin domain-containing protein n=1 Tax=Parascaris univalens TaxID=6257 RepID=A0A915BVX1_PARUN